MKLKFVATAALFFAVSVSSAFAETLKGTISDSMCGAQHVNATKEDMECAQKCVKGGSAAVLVVGDKIYKIANQDAVKDHIGHKVTITGAVTGDSVHVDSVKM